MKLNLPQNWSARRLNSVAKVSIGLVTTMTEHYAEFGVPLIRNSDIKENRITKEKLIKLTFQFAEQYPTRKLMIGDIVTVHTGEVGVSAIIDNELDGCFGFATINTRLDKGIIVPEFLCWYFNSPKFISHCVSLSTGDGRQNLNLKDFAKVTIPVPPLPEQKKIAQILSTWDQAISTTGQLLANSQQQKKALMQQLLTGKKRLLDKNGVRFSGEWKLSSVDRFIKESRIPGNNGDTAKKLTVKLYGNGVVAKDEKRAGSESTKYYTRKAGQFIYSKLDFLNGAFGLIPDSLDGFESTLDLPAFDFLDTVCVRWFIYFVSREEFYTSNLGLANGGRKARRVNPIDFLKIVIPTPRLDEQQKIASVLTAADQEIETLQRKLDCLKQEKKALMQQLLTGKRRVQLD